MVPQHTSIAHCEDVVAPRDPGVTGLNSILAIIGADGKSPTAN